MPSSSPGQSGSGKRHSGLGARQSPPRRGSSSAAPRQALTKDEIARVANRHKRGVRDEVDAFKQGQKQGRTAVQQAGDWHKRHRLRRDLATVEEDAASTALMNYRPTLLLLLAQLMTLLFLGLVVLGTPNELSAVFINGQEMVGIFRKCTGGQCTDWMQHEGATSDSGSSSSTDALSDLLRRQSIGGTTSAESDAAPARGSGTLKYEQLASPAGTMLLVVFWTTGYCLLFLLIRYPLSIARPRKPPPLETDEKGRIISDESSDTEHDPKDVEARAAKPGQKIDDRTRWERFKLFGYRAGRAMQVTNAIMLPIGVILVAIFVVQSQGALGFGTMQGIGGGVYLLSFALVGTAYCTAVEFAPNGGRVRQWLSLAFFCSKIPWCRATPDKDDLPPPYTAAAASRPSSQASYAESKRAPGALRKTRRDQFSKNNKI